MDEAVVLNNNEQETIMIHIDSALIGHKPIVMMKPHNTQQSPLWSMQWLHEPIGGMCTTVRCLQHVPAMKWKWKVTTGSPTTPHKHRIDLNSLLFGLLHCYLSVS